MSKKHLFIAIHELLKRLDEIEPMPESCISFVQSILDGKREFYLFFVLAGSLEECYEEKSYRSLLSVVALDFQLKKLKTDKTFPDKAQGIHDDFVNKEDL